MTHHAFRDRRSDTIVIYATFFLFLVLTIWGISHHEPWRDEFHSAMIALRSQSVAHLLQLKAYEGHPSLWYILLYFLWQITPHWAAMLWLNLFFAAAAVWVFLKYAPLSLWLRSSIVLGYFFIFEYSVFARNYAIELFFIFSICALLPQRRQVGIQFLLALLLALLMQTNIYGLMIAGLLGGFLAWDLVWPNIQARQWAVVGRLALWAGLPLVIGGGIAVWTIIPPADSGIMGSPTSLMNVFRSIGNVWAAYMPLPSIRLDFWNSNIIGWGDSPFNGHFRTPFALTILVIITRLWRQHREVLWLFWLGTLLFMIFTLTCYTGWLRHHGHLYIWFVICLWLKGLFEQEGQYPPATEHRVRLHPIVQKGFLPLVLGTQIVSGLIALAMDTWHPFSMGAETAAFLKANQKEYDVISGFEDFSAEPYTAYLGHNIYHPSIRDTAFFVTFSDRRNMKLYPKDVVNNVLQDFPNKERVWLIFNRPLDDSLHIPVEPIKRFEGSIVTDEQFYIYKLKGR